MMLPESDALTTAMCPLYSANKAMMNSVALPSVATMLSRSAGLKPRNWMCAWPARMAATCADDDLMKTARNPSRYALPLSQ